MPLMVAPVVGALAWRFVFADGYGMLDSLMNSFGGEVRSGSPMFGSPAGPILIAGLWMAPPLRHLGAAGWAGQPSDRAAPKRRASMAPRRARSFPIIPCRCSGR